MNLEVQIKKFLQKTQEEGKPPLIVILGPTASGKTDLSLKLAAKFKSEIVSADSRQVYRGMDLGTDKVPPKIRKKIPHHLIDLLNPDQPFTLGIFKKKALAAIHDILKRGKIPFLVGGTGLYLRSLTQNYQIPALPPNPKLRARLEKEAQKKGTEFLHQKLKKLDPKTAAKIHPRNLRYLIRALEIILTTQKTKKERRGKPLFAVFSIGIKWPREVLYERIEKRVDEQVKNGLLEETKRLLAQGYSEKLPSMSSLGYRELARYLKGELTWEEAVLLIKKNTRHYARRQITWFRKDRDTYWVSGEKIFKK